MGCMCGVLGTQHTTFGQHAGVPKAVLLLQVAPLGLDGGPDLEALAATLRRHAAAPLIVGCFPAGSAITGLAPDPRPVARLLHAHGAVSAWDCEDVAAPHGVRMAAPDGDDAAALDAAFFSPHKLTGGAGASGVLVVRKVVVRATGTLAPCAFVSAL